MTDEARAADSPPRPAVHIPRPIYLYVIFDGPPSAESGRFVELEDEHGQGVSAGQWKERGDGLWALGPFLQPPAETAVPPDTDLRAMVAAILRQTSLPPGSMTMDAWAVHLTLIHDTAERLALALEQREGVMEEMAKALEGSMAAIYRVAPPSTGPDDDADGWACIEIQDANRAALAKYQAARQPREASSTEGGQ